MALLPWLTGQVITIKNVTADTKRFWIKVPEIAAFHFIPGQFITLDLPIHEKVNKRLRSYSIASWPDGTNVLELIIVLDKNGSGTNYLFNEIAVGSSLIFRGPQGVFQLKEPIEKDIVMICTGTGIAPFRSMVQHIQLQNILHKNIYLVFGCRTQNDLLYFQELTNLQKSMNGFYYLPTISREKWAGPTGYVHPLYEAICNDKRPVDFYLCGWKGMIDEATQKILNMGYDKKNIFKEIYG